MSEKQAPLGRMHQWWLKRFKLNGKCAVGYGYEGTPYGQALLGLIKRGIIVRDMSFESGIVLYKLVTPEDERR